MDTKKFFEDNTGKKYIREIYKYWVEEIKNEKIMIEGFNYDYNTTGCTSSGRTIHQDYQGIK